jgi:SAM-dependent methyltransferase
MSEERRVAPAPLAPDLASSSAAEGKVSPSVKPERVSSVPPPGEPTMARRRSRMSLRIPDDEVARPLSSGRDVARVADAAEDRTPAVPRTDEGPMVQPMRIITINPPKSPSEPPPPMAAQAGRSQAPPLRTDGPSGIAPAAPRLDGPPGAAVPPPLRTDGPSVGAQLHEEELPVPLVASAVRSSRPGSVPAQRASVPVATGGVAPSSPAPARPSAAPVGVATRSSFPAAAQVAPHLSSAPPAPAAQLSFPPPPAVPIVARGRSQPPPAPDSGPAVAPALSPSSPPPQAERVAPSFPPPPMAPVHVPSARPLAPSPAQATPSPAQAAPAPMPAAPPEPPIQAAPPAPSFPPMEAASPAPSSPPPQAPAPARLSPPPPPPPVALPSPAPEAIAPALSFPSPPPAPPIPQAPPSPSPVLVEAPPPATTTALTVPSPRASPPPVKPSPRPSPPISSPPMPSVEALLVEIAEHHEISPDDLVPLDATPLPPRLDAIPPPARQSSASHPPPVSRKPPPPVVVAPPPTIVAAPPRRPSKPPLVIVPPHMGNLAPPQPDGATARRKNRLWWEDLFNDDYVRACERITPEQLDAEVNFVEESLGVERGGALLDLACGTGRHAVELARRGYQVVGFDLSLAMLALASDEAQERSAKLNFVQGDMREMAFAEQFDGVYCWNTSFGYFDEEKNALIVDRIHSALKGGGLFLLDVVNRDFLIQQSPSLAWFEGDGCVCMDEMNVDFITSRMRVKRTMMLDDGRTREMEYAMRVYSLHELGKMLHEHGFKVCEVSGRIATPGVFFGHESPRTIILAEKR